jgi:hypothetical protein
MGIGFGDVGKSEVGIETIGENEIEEKPYFSFFDNIFLITDLGEFLITDTGERLVID